MKKIISNFLVIFVTASVLGACNGESKSFETTAELTTVSAEMTSQINYITGDEIITSISETTTAEETREVMVYWHLGYIGSSSHSSYAYIINKNGTYYSYSDVITIEKAGTKIWFLDDNTSSNGDSGFTSSAALVISSWEIVDGSWQINKEGTNIAGSGSTNSTIAKNENGVMLYSYITSKDNENIRLSFRSGQTSSFTPATFPTVYYKSTLNSGTATVLGEIQKDYDTWIAESKQTSYYNILEGVTMNVLGDSYFAGDSLETKYVWCSLLAEKYDMIYNNKGRNGSTISDYATTSNPMVVRYTDMPLNNADIILIEGGKNDFNKNTPIGKNDDFTTKTYKGALKFLIEKMQKRYPEALIICVTVWNAVGTNSLGNKISDYGDAMIEICQLYNIPCFNAMDISLSGVDMTSISFRSKYCLTSSDISHLNIAGHRMVMPNFEKFIAEELEAYLISKYN